VVWLDAATTDLLNAHRKAQLTARLRSGAWQDSDLVFCDALGLPLKPDAVSRRFKVLAKVAGLPPIKLHEGRHSAASLARTLRSTRRSAAGRSDTLTRR
jgi:hypothetical protein